MATDPNTLYDEDFYAWTVEQAAVLRTQAGRDNRLDIEHLAEEIEDIGRSQLEAVESYVENVIEHMLKLDYSALVEPRDYWRAEIDAFRRSIARKMTTRIGQLVEAEIETLYRHARRAAARSLHRTEPDFAQRLPKACPYDWNTILHRDVMREGGIELPD
jgi:hypothetical protein